jgi:hypothetical protein
MAEKCCALQKRNIEENPNGNIKNDCNQVLNGCPK